jgi:phage host-nuclease inhibitor protein Gam
MTKPRIKKPVLPALTSRAAFEALVGELAGDIIHQRDLTNDRDRQLLEIRQRYEADLVALDEQIDARVRVAHEYCDAHPEMFPKDRKSLDLQHAVVGYRTGTPAAKPMRGWKWDAILAAIKARKWLQFIRTKEEADKEALIAARDTHPLETVGVQIVQEETFFVEPKLEAETTKLSTEAA